MTNSESLAHTPTLFESLDIMNLSDLSEFNIVSYMYKQIKLLLFLKSLGFLWEFMS